ncbi:hypothetical protein SNEBB_007671 [Seison nebaliae]|nr:hypothetical protein SNEBB_007671 [Seison nebaliae]
MSLPNILICGTPGTGKSALSEEIRKIYPNYQMLKISEYAKKEGCAEEFDEKLNCHIIDEEKLYEKLKSLNLEENHPNNYLIEYHESTIFDTDWFSAIFILGCDNDVLYDRLQNRNYSKKKIDENLQCEIMQIIYIDTIEDFSENKCILLQSNNWKDMERNIQIIHDRINSLILK